MEDRKLEIRTLEEDRICDYCNSPMEAGDIVYIVTIYMEDGCYEYYFDSQNCLDEYEAEELLNELHQEDKYYYGLS